MQFVPVQIPANAQQPVAAPAAHGVHHNGRVQCVSPCEDPVCPKKSLGPHAHCPCTICEQLRGNPVPRAHAPVQAIDGNHAECSCVKCSAKR